ncbi:ABC transporter ATP-binding protein [Vibrio sp. M260118]|uniref:ABC transporter ATP-binding protein n=1 Tax=Vibrio sp. M260118 TaxID=3020896 RepID=UPI002F3ED213
MKHKPLLELWNVSKIFPGVIANDNVNLKLFKGEILALLGENGAGKSTLVKMIYGVNRPDKGAILWNNQEVDIRTPNQARTLGIGMVFQHFSVFETLTVQENIELGLDNSFLDQIDNLKQRIVAISKKYDLHVDPDRYVHSLSIGERQRLEILRCLIPESYPKKRANETIFETHNLTLPPSHPFGCGLNDVSLKLKAGEILGIAGVAGNGQEDLLEALSGEDTRANNSAVLFRQQPVGNLNAGARRKLGMAYVPADRLGQGAVPEMSLTDNTLLTNSSNLAKHGFVLQNKLRKLADQIIKSNQVKCHNQSSQAKSLSGGNLQKFIIGREVEQQPNVLICAHPTWGVDIAAASAIHRQLIALRDSGAAVLVISEDIDELFVICDRMSALYEGQLSEAVNTEETCIEEVGKWIAGSFVTHKEVSNG